MLTCHCVEQHAGPGESKEIFQKSAGIVVDDAMACESDVRQGLRPKIQDKKPPSQQNLCREYGCLHFSSQRVRDNRVS